MIQYGSPLSLATLLCVSCGQGPDATVPTSIPSMRGSGAITAADRLPDGKPCLTEDQLSDLSPASRADLALWCANWADKMFPCTSDVPLTQQLICRAQVEQLGASCLACAGLSTPARQVACKADCDLTWSSCLGAGRDDDRQTCGNTGATCEATCLSN